MLQLLTPTRAKFIEAKAKNLKIGEKDSRDGISIKLAMNLPNTALAMFDPALREVLYGAGSPGGKQRKQAELDGVEPASDRPALTRTGQHLRRWAWDEKQTGCTLTVDKGVGGIVLSEGTVQGLVVSLNEGGTIRVQLEFHAPVDHLTPEQGWNLSKTRKQEVNITLAGPQVDQQDLEEEEDDGEAGATPPAGKGRRGGTAITPIEALKKADKAANSGQGKAAA